MPKLSELQAGSNIQPTAARNAFLGTAEAQGFEDLRSHVLAQEKARKEAERERRLDLGLDPEDEGNAKPGIFKKVFRKLSSASQDGGKTEKDLGHGKPVYRSETSADEGPGNMANETRTTNAEN